MEELPDVSTGFNYSRFMCIIKSVEMSPRETKLEHDLESHEESKNLMV